MVGVTAIKRDPAGAATEHYDMIIIGGGIYGVALAFEAARHGVRPMLLDRGDFGAATSWNSLRIVHGGLRYLQALDLMRFRQSVGERAWWLRNFPDLVEPLACLMPLYGNGLRRPAVFRAAFAADHVLSWRRNQGIRADRRLAPGRVIDRAATMARYPAIPSRNLQGGALWHDAAMANSQRLLIELLRWAVADGATAANYVEVTGLLQNNRGAVTGVRARDGQAGGELTLRAPVVVNCAGPAVRRLAAAFDRDVPALFQPSLAFNLFLDRPPLSDAALAVAPPHAGARTYFLHPWQGRILAGTYHAPWTGDDDPPVPDDAMIEDCINDLNQAVPELAVTADQIIGVHAGLLPAARPGGAELSVRPIIHDHGRHDGPDGLFSVSGVKFTTARLVAAAAIHTIGAARNWPRRPSTGQRPAPTVIPDTAAMIELSDHEPETARRLVGRLIAEEAVVQPDDLLLRRTGWGTLPADAARLKPLIEAAM